MQLSNIIFAYEILLRVCSIKVSLRVGLDDTSIPFKLKIKTKIKIFFKLSSIVITIRIKDIGDIQFNDNFITLQ